QRGKLGITRALRTRPGNRRDDDRELPQWTGLAAAARLRMDHPWAPSRRISHRWNIVAIRRHLQTSTWNANACAAYDLRTGATRSRHGAMVWWLSAPVPPD